MELKGAKCKQDPNIKSEIVTAKEYNGGLLSVLHYLESDAFIVYIHSHRKLRTKLYLHLVERHMSILQQASCKLGIRRVISTTIVSFSACFYPIFYVDKIASWFSSVGLNSLTML